MTASNFQVTFDANDPDMLANFWKEALGYKFQDPPEGFASWEEFLIANNIDFEPNSATALVDPDGVKPRIYFQRVPEAKSAKNRVHIDINVVGRRGVDMQERRSLLNQQADRLVALGATKTRLLDEEGELCVVMADPEGNEFCIQ